MMCDGSSPDLSLDFNFPCFFLSSNGRIYETSASWWIITMFIHLNKSWSILFYLNGLEWKLIRSLMDHQLSFYIDFNLISFYLVLKVSMETSHSCDGLSDKPSNINVSIVFTSIVLRFVSYNVTLKKIKTTWSFLKTHNYS